MLQLVAAAACSASPYELLPLSTPSGALRANIYLPPADASDAAALARTFYRSSRFDWGSMVGDFTLGGHALCEADSWRAPHDPAWTEAAIGLAGEFGCGDDGATCPAGWRGAGSESARISNGVLGYEEAAPGGAFLKVGVGALRKGSCAACNSAAPDDLYRFNEPYAFAAPPSWRVNASAGGSVVALEHDASLPGGRWGYSLRRTLELVDLPPSARAGLVGGLVLESWELRNRGRDEWQIPFYSHNFWHADGAPTDERWSATLDGLDTAYYTDGAASWAEPLATYARAGGGDGSLAWARVVEGGTKIKANFAQPSHAQGAAQPSGAFSLRCGALSVRSEQRLLPPSPLYAYNLYAEAATLSPEPVALVRLGAGQSAQWSRTLTIAIGAADPSVAKARATELLPPLALSGAAVGGAAGAPRAPAARGSARTALGVASCAGLFASAAAAFLLRLRTWRAAASCDAPWPRAALAVGAPSSFIPAALRSPGGRPEAECELLSAHDRPAQHRAHGGASSAADEQRGPYTSI
ncbi:hypothetical protein KFE25_003765 [Diacronema lutheri]|uniref:Uncharacterized protein n=1 Tax=Diacronema lutheri TaxID=2081491 RepID=A0A8J6C3J1_DIALT|nr:hypothetical protein KFE25_003765 [Diacronema lutheri]